MHTRWNCVWHLTSGYFPVFFYIQSHPSMKKIFFTITCLFLFSLASKAQNPGCDGSRYKDDVFQGFTKTTVEYAPTVSHLGGDMTLSMDVYEPSGDQIAQRPVVILAHGGSFIFGDRTMMARWCELLAKKGYVAATISYRLYPFLVLGFPDSLAIFDTAVKAVGDMRAAVRFFREDAATANQFRADVDHIFIGGYSAGAVTALHCAYLDLDNNIPAFLQTLIDNNGGLEGISGTTSNKTFGSTSKAVVNMSGGLYRSAWIDEDESPLVSIHGTADGTVPYTYGLAANIAYLEGSSLLHIRADNVNLWNSLVSVPGGDHTDIYDNASFQPFVDSFWVNATTMLEDITCSTSGTQEQVQWINGWAVSPNPVTNGTITLQIPEAFENLSVKIVNAVGKLIYQQDNISDGSSIDVGQLVPGVYFVQVIQEVAQMFDLPLKS